MRLYIQGGEDGHAFKADWADLLVIATTTVTGVAATITRGLDMVDDLARAHANYRRERSDWASELVKEIENL